MSYHQNFCCNICQKNLGQYTQVDHILCIERYNNNDIQNHQILCINCHTWKSHYIDKNINFIKYVSKLQILNKDLYYKDIINKIRELHSLDSSNCSCKLDYMSEVNKKVVSKSCFSYIRNFLNF